jgi:hypothetical protein
LENRSKAARSIFLIGHRCNDIPTIDKAFRQKVNGIECDLWADSKKKWWISHGGCKKRDLLEWLTYIGEAEEKFSRRLELIVFDIKSPQPFKGVRDLIQQILRPGLRVVYSTAKISKAHIFTDIVPLLTTNEVIAIDEEDDPKEVAEFFRKIGASQCWYGNGITLVPFDHLFHDSMKEASLLKNSTAPFSKVYTWSIHRRKSLYRYMIEDKVDAMIVGLDSFLTKPVSNAIKIISNNENVKLADNNTKLY